MIRYNRQPPPKFLGVEVDIWPLVLMIAGIVSAFVLVIYITIAMTDFSPRGDKSGYQMQNERMRREAANEHAQQSLRIYESFKVEGSN